MDPNSPNTTHIADTTYLDDYAGWVSSIHTVEARALVAAIREAKDRDLRKALSTRLVQSRVNALLSIGYFYVAIRDRFGTSLLHARLNASVADARAALRKCSDTTTNGFWSFLHIPDPDTLRSHKIDAHVINQYVDSGAQRLANAPRIGQLARQDMLLSTMAAHRSNRVILSSPRSVSLIKTGQESELHGLSNTAFYLVDISTGQFADSSDLVAVASPTTPAVVEDIAEEIEFIDTEAAATATLVATVAKAGLLYVDSTPQDP